MSASRRTLRLDASREQDILRAAELLRRGGLVAFPTETVYGLGANALDPVAVAGIFRAKDRPSWDPLIVHVPAPGMVEQIAELGARDAGSGPQGLLRRRVETLSRSFWPGPLTLLVPRSRTVPDAVTAGGDRIGVRIPAHTAALALLRQAGIPVAAPSANRFGHTSPTTAEHVLHDLDGRIDAVLDGGATSIGVESTVVDLCGTPARVYRPGGIPVAVLRAVLGEVEVYRPVDGASGAPGQGLPSPGLDLRHYAPRLRLYLVADQAELLERVAALGQNGTPGVMLPDGWDPGRSGITFAWGRWDRPQVLARNLFAGLRWLDEQSASAIVCPLPPEETGLYAALRDRLLKASRSD